MSTAEPPAAAADLLAMLLPSGSAAPSEPVNETLALQRLLEHELRTPLNAIAVGAELLLSGAWGRLPGSALEPVLTMARSVGAIREAVAAGREIITLEACGPPVGGKASASGCVELLPLLRACGFRVEPSSTEGTLRVNGDQRSWGRVIACCARFLASDARSAVDLSAQAAVDAWGVRVVELQRDPAAGPRHDTRNLEILLAGRLARMSGCELSLPADGIVRLQWREPG